MESISNFLEDQIGPPGNKEKSQVFLLKDVEQLGFQILRDKNHVSTKARELTKRNNPLWTNQIIQFLNVYLRGWVVYYRVQEFRKVFRKLDEFINNRIRSRQLKRWKNPRKFQWIIIRA